MQQTVDRLLDAATEKFQNTVQKQLDHAAENMEKFQKLILDQFKTLRPAMLPAVTHNAPYSHSLSPTLHAGPQMLHYGHSAVHSPPLLQELMVGADRNGPGNHE